MINALAHQVTKQITLAHEVYAAYAPRKGQAVTFEGAIAGTVTRVEGGLCWIDDSPDRVFIWCFRRGLNELHNWSTKAAAAEREIYASK